MVSDCDLSDDSADDDDDEYFTDVEKKAIEENSKMLNQDKIRELLEKDKYIDLISDMSIKSAKLSEVKNLFTNKSTFYWYLSYSTSGDTKPRKTLSIELDAVTGEIIDFTQKTDKIEGQVTPVLDVKKANSMQFFYDYVISQSEQ